MEHVVTAPHGGIVRTVTMTKGDVVREGFPIVFFELAEVKGGLVAASAEIDLDHIRDDLARKHRTACADTGREPARCGRPSAQDRPPNAARKHCAPGRSRLVQRILATGGGPPAPAKHDGGAAQEHARRWRRRRHLLDQRRPVRRDALARRSGALRLHRAGRHAGRPQPLQAGSHLRAVPPLSPAAGAVRRRGGGRPGED